MQKIISTRSNIGTFAETENGGPKATEIISHCTCVNRCPFTVHLYMLSSNFLYEFNLNFI